MKSLSYLFYNSTVIPIIFILLRIGALFNSKIRRGLKERKKIFENLIKNLAGLDRSKKMIWFHSSSMGEFEQAKPIIQKLKSTKDVNLIVTFFSPSGYDNSKNYPYADVISYIPFDTPAKSAKFINLVNPDLMVLMRYDIWPNFIWQLKKTNIPMFIVDATMRKSTKRKWLFIESFHKALFKNFDRILAVSDDDVKNFMDFGLNEDNVKAVGDTRFDRVHQKSVDAKNKRLFNDGFFDNKKVFVFGSSWESDEDVILPAFEKVLDYDKDVIMILAPHEPSVLRLEKLENRFSKRISSIRFSYLNNYQGEKVIIIDSIGILLTLYFYADVSYVGGSFRQGIHNVLEPAVYGIPVLFGPKIENSQEAQILSNLGGGILVQNKRSAYKNLRKLLNSEDLRKQTGDISYKYVRQNIGATGKILEEIYKFIE